MKRQQNVLLILLEKLELAMKRRNISCIGLKALYHLLEMSWKTWAGFKKNRRHRKRVCDCVFRKTEDNGPTGEEWGERQRHIQGEQ